MDDAPLTDAIRERIAGLPGPENLYTEEMFDEMTFHAAKMERERDEARAQIAFGELSRNNLARERDEFSAYAAAFHFQQVHGLKYDGPTYVEEMQALRVALDKNPTAAPLGGDAHSTANESGPAMRPPPPDPIEPLTGDRAESVAALRYALEGCITHIEMLRDGGDNWAPNSTAGALERARAALSSRTDSTKE